VVDGISSVPTAAVGTDDHAVAASCSPARPTSRTAAAIPGLGEAIAKDVVPYPIMYVGRAIPWRVTLSDSPRPAVAPCSGRPDGDRDGGQQGKDGYGQRTQGIPNHDVPSLLVDQAEVVQLAHERSGCVAGISSLPTTQQYRPLSAITIEELLTIDGPCGEGVVFGPRNRGGGHSPGWRGLVFTTATGRHLEPRN